MAAERGGEVGLDEVVREAIGRVPRRKRGCCGRGKTLRRLTLKPSSAG